MLAPAALLDIGLVYEVAKALCISLIFHAIQLQGNVTPRDSDWRKTVLVAT